MEKAYLTMSTERKMIQMRQLVDKDIITIVIILIYVLKKLEERCEQRISEL